MNFRKISFSAIVLMMAVGGTFAKNAEKMGGRVVTACFALVSLQNGPGTLFYTPGLTDDCADVIDHAIFNNTLWLRTNPTCGINIRTGCEPDLQEYCCMIFELDATAPITVPNTTPCGAAAGKYKVKQILCEPTF